MFYDLWNLTSATEAPASPSNTEKNTNNATTCCPHNHHLIPITSDTGVSSNDNHPTVHHHVINNNHPVVHQNGRVNFTNHTCISSPCRKRSFSQANATSSLSPSIPQHVSVEYSLMSPSSVIAYSFQTLSLCSKELPDYNTNLNAGEPNHTTVNKPAVSATPAVSPDPSTRPPRLSVVRKSGASSGSSSSCSSPSTTAPHSYLSPLAALGNNNESPRYSARSRPSRTPSPTFFGELQTTTVATFSPRTTSSPAPALLVKDSPAHDENGPAVKKRRLKLSIALDSNDEDDCIMAPAAPQKHVSTPTSFPVCVSICNSRPHNLSSLEMTVRTASTNNIHPAHTLSLSAPVQKVKNLLVPIASYTAVHHHQPTIISTGPSLHSSASASSPSP